MPDIPYEPLNQVPFVFPLKGKSQGWSRDAQPEGTTPDCLNVWPIDLTTRARGGTRPGFSKANSSPLGSSPPYMQAISEVDGINFTTGLRVTYFAAFAAGVVYSGLGPDSLDVVTNLDISIPPAPAATGIYQTTQVQGRLVFLDGASVWQLIPSYQAGSIDPAITTPGFGHVGATAGGTSPAAYGYQCCCTYRGRLVLGNQGATGNPQEWIMSRVLNIDDWNVAKRDPAAAVAGSSSSTAGQVGEPITALVPISDDLLLFGADHSLWMLSGDPGFGGVITPVNRGVGMFGPNSWALDPDRDLYFVGTGGFFRLRRAGFQVENLSLAKLDDYFNGLVRGTHFVRCEWDRERHGCWIFATHAAANEVFACPFVDSSGMDDFTITVETVTTGSIVYSATPAVLIARMNAAMNTTYGVNSIVASGTTLANIIFTCSGGAYAGRSVGLPTFTLTSGTGFTAGPATVVTVGGTQPQSTHLWWDATTEGFFPMQFPTAMGPTASCTFDDGSANGLSLLLGGFNGQIYKPAPTAGSDDGTAINSYVWLGPVRPYGGGQRGKMVALDVILGETAPGFSGANCFATGTMQWADDPYNALAAPISTASNSFLTVGRNTLWRVRGRGTHAMLKLAQTTAGKTMTLESVVGQWLPGGRVRA